MEPKIAKKGPYEVELEAGKNYHWCTCGASNKQPFCDGSHHGTEFKPIAFEAKETGKAHLCGCKHSKNSPYCDGSHHKL